MDDAEYVVRAEKWINLCGLDTRAGWWKRQRKTGRWEWGNEAGDAVGFLG